MVGCELDSKVHNAAVLVFLYDYSSSILAAPFIVARLLIGKCVIAITGRTNLKYWPNNNILLTLCIYLVIMPIIKQFLKLKKSKAVNKKMLLLLHKLIHLKYWLNNNALHTLCSYIYILCLCHYSSSCSYSLRKSWDRDCEQ